MFVIFDLDRVLIQNPFMFGVFPDVCERLRPYVPKDVPEEDADHWIVARIYRRHRELLLAGDWVPSSDWDGIVNHVARELGYDRDIDVTGLVRHYARPPYIAAYPDAVAVLPWLRQNAKSLWWISNGFARYQVPVMEALGLQPYFDGYFAPDTHGSVKPYAAIFDAAVAAAGEDRTQGVMVGDSLSTDVAGGMRSGLYTVWLDRMLNPVFARTAPWEIPASPLFRTYVTRTIRSEFSPDAYRLRLPEDCIPHAVIGSLEQLPEVLSRRGQVPAAQVS